jgi:F-type H+-transporting ATPase subunit a
MHLLPGLPSFDHVVPEGLFQISSWSWFHLIPGIGDGSAFPFIGEESAQFVHTIPGAWTACLILCIGALVARAGLDKARAKGGTLQYVPAADLKPRNLFELVVGNLLDLFADVLGSRAAAERYFPLFAGLFFYILACNLLGLLPGFLPPTASISTNWGMALVVFLVFNIEGLRVNGMAYVKHLAGPILWLAPLMFVLEVVGLLFRPFTLSVRLMGNMNGDHMVLSIFSELVPFLVPSIFMALGTFVCLVQAFVFTLLSVVYVSLAIAHEESH